MLVMWWRLLEAIGTSHFPLPLKKRRVERSVRFTFSVDSIGKPQFVQDHKKEGAVAGMTGWSSRGIKDLRSVVSQVTAGHLLTSKSSIGGK